MVKFIDIKDQLVEQISKLSKNSFPEEKDGFTLIEGFFQLPLKKEISSFSDSDLYIPNFPIVAILGNTSGIIYFLPLKKLIPTLNI